MKRFLAFLLMLTLCLSLAACSSSDEGGQQEEEKKELPTNQTTEPEGGEEAAPHYRDIMIPFEDLIPAERIVILQNTLNFGREGFYTEATKPVAEELTLDGATVKGYKLTHALSFLTYGYENGAVVTDAAGNSETYTKEQLEAAYVLIEDFQSYELPRLYDPASGKLFADFDHLIPEGTEQKEMVISIVTEQDRRFPDMFALVGWDTASTNYHVMATDKFYIPVTPVDYDDGELRGALSGSINGTFPDCTVAQGKINDVIYVEKVVN